jgi:putative RNA 2'-phosphotransferase
VEDARIVRISRFLSKHLRHQPQRLGLTLQPGGWVAVDVLLAACVSHGMPLSREELDEVVARNDKRRFSFDESGERIRANQGHSVAIDLRLTPVTPPAILYHGTSQAVVGVKVRAGLRKMRRHHVHLSADIPTAIKVGRRHGQPVVFAVDAGAMSADGHAFFCSENGVWLVDAVAPRYLQLLVTADG